MIRKENECKIEFREHMRDGDGTVKLTNFINAPEELCGKGRLFSKITLNPGCGIGYHVHETDEEIYEDQIVAVYKAYYTWFDETETEYLVVTLSPIDKSYDYTQIDTLISNDMLDIDAYYSGEDLNEVLEEITTEHNRDTVTALSI